MFRNLDFPVQMNSSEILLLMLLILLEAPELLLSVVDLSQGKGSCKEQQAVTAAICCWLTHSTEKRNTHRKQHFPKLFQFYSFKSI